MSSNYDTVYQRRMLIDLFTHWINCDTDSHSSATGLLVGAAE